MKKTILVRLVLIASLITVLITSISCGESETPDIEPIKIAEIIPLQYTSGKLQNMAGVLAVEEINAAGGVQVGNVKRPIELITIDSNEFVSVPDATSAVERAITVDKADFIMGGFRSEAVFSMSDVAMDYQKIFLGTGAASQGLNDRVLNDYDRYKYFFMPSYPDANVMGEAIVAMGEMAASAVRDELGIDSPKIAILAEQALWVDPTVELAQERFSELGFDIVGTWRPSSMATDVSAELNAIKTKDAQVIFVVFSGPVAIAYSRQRSELEIPAVTAGYSIEAQLKDYWTETEGGANYEGPYYHAIQRVDITPETVDYWDSFVEKWDEYPHIVATDYHPIYILKEAIERAGTLDSDAVVAELEKTDAITPVGRIVFDEDHNVKYGPGYYTFVGYQWHDEELKCVWPPVNGDWNDVVYKGTAAYELPPLVKEYWGSSN